MLDGVRIASWPALSKLSPTREPISGAPAAPAAATVTISTSGSNCAYSCFAVTAATDVLRPGLLDRGEVAALQAWAVEIEAWPSGSHVWGHYAEQTALGPRICRTENVSACHTGVASLVNGALQARASEALGEPAVAFKDKLNYKQPGGAGFGVHQDKVAYPGAGRVASILVAIDDCTVESGCLWLAGGVREVLPVDDRGVVRRDVAADLEWIPAELAAGDAVVIDGLAPHYSQANGSDAPRRVLIASYAPASEGYDRAHYYGAGATGCGRPPTTTGASASARSPTSKGPRSHRSPRPRCAPTRRIGAVPTEMALLARILVGFGLAFVIGFERELRGSPAGDRTFALVGGASAAVAATVASSSPQALAGVITGIGFIGAGVVVQFRPRHRIVVGTGTSGSARRPRSQFWSCSSSATSRCCTGSTRVITRTASGTTTTRPGRFDRDSARSEPPPRSAPVGAGSVDRAPFSEHWSSMTNLLAVELSAGHLAVAVTCAVGAAFSYGLSNVLQQHEAEQLPEESTLRLGLIAQLARRPRWVVGMGADVGGYVFEALAIGTGTLVLVEPILATSLLFSLLLGMLINKRPVDRAGWAAAAVLAIGVSLFLSLIAPTQGTSIAPTRSWLFAAPPIVGFVLICVTLARAAEGTNRAVFLGLAAGTLFGVSAVLTKAFVHYLGEGIFDLGAALGAVRARGQLDHRPRARAERLPDRRVGGRHRRGAGHATAHGRRTRRRPARGAPRHHRLGPDALAARRARRDGARRHHARARRAPRVDRATHPARRRVGYAGRLARRRASGRAVARRSRRDGGPELSSRIKVDRL